MAAEASGTATSNARYPQAVGVTVAAKYRVPVSVAVASAGRIARNTPMPTAVPRTALITESTEAITLMSPGVAPTSRSAAKRSSRRVAASRVAVLIRISTGNRTASAPVANAYRKNGVNTSGPGPVPIAVTHWVPGTRASAAGSYPTYTTSSFGPVSAAPPIVPASVPGNRSPSWSRGAVWIRWASAGEARYWPGPGSRGMPGGTDAPGPRAATSSRSMVCP